MAEPRTPRRYDRRSHAELLADPLLVPWQGLPGLGNIPRRPLKALLRFLAHTEAAGLTEATVADLCAFAQLDGAKGVLADLQTALRRVLPPDAGLHATLTEAIRQRRPRSRRCDRRTHAQIAADPLLAPYRDLDGFAEVGLEELRVLDRFLRHARCCAIEIPTVGDFLEFSADTGSSRRLCTLESAFSQLLPGNPAVVLTLRDAIRAKTAPQPGPKPVPRARQARLSLGPEQLPIPWQRALAALARGEMLAGLQPLGESTVANMSQVLRSYAGTLAHAGRVPELTLDGVRLHEAAQRARGLRPATLQTTALRLLQFAERIDAEPAFLAALRVHLNVLRRELDSVVPLKEARFSALPGLDEVWARAEALCKASRTEATPAKRLKARNEAFILAFWTLVPLRLGDGRLRWGRDILWEEDGWGQGRYRIEIMTSKTGAALSGPLHPRLTPFLDQLALGDVDPAYLPQMRHRAMEGQLPLLRDTTGRQLSRGYPSRVWARQFGTGAHIARTQLHTELGRLGPDGVDAALALCAQSDPRTASHYQTRAFGDRRMREGQALIESLQADCLDT